MRILYADVCFPSLGTRLLTDNQKIHERVLISPDTDLSRVFDNARLSVVVDEVLHRESDVQSLR